MPPRIPVHAFAWFVLSATLSVAHFGPASADTVVKGTFQGLSGHATSGAVVLQQSGDSATVEFGSDFSFDGAPDPKIGFGKDGRYDPQTTLAPLKSNKGAQTYSAPASIDAGDYNEVYVWCEQYNVPLGVARVK